MEEKLSPEEIMTVFNNLVQRVETLETTVDELESGVSLATSLAREAKEMIANLSVETTNGFDLAIQALKTFGSVAGGVTFVVGLGVLFYGWPERRPKEETEA